MVLIIPLIAVVTILAAWAVHERSTANLQEKLTQRARSLHTQIMADRQYYALVIVPRLIELGGSLGPDYRQVHGRFPLPATFVREVSELTARTRDGYTTNLISPWAINKEKGLKDQFQREAFAYLADHPTGQFFSTDTIKGQAVMRVLMADLASAKSCVDCHNAHPQSPKRDFKLNDLMGGLEIVVPTDQYLQESQRDLAITMAGGTVLCLMVLGVVALATKRVVTRPLARLAGRMQRVAGTRGAVSAQAVSAPPGDEMAYLTETFMEMEAIIAMQQQSLQEANERLTQRVVERTEALQSAEERLRQSQKLEAIGKLAGGVAHDFNNLLTAIMGYSELLLSHLQPEDQARKNAEQIRHAAVRAAALTHQLLAFGRRQVLAAKVLDLNAVAMNLEPMLRRLIGEDLELVIVPCPGLGQVRADPGQIEQVIMNLAINARDAMPRGGKLTIETANVELDAGYVRQQVSVRPGPYVLLAVSDTGCGMNAETQAHIFEPFFTTKEQGKGTGLGLATVYGIVKQSDGYVWVYSEPGHGTTFKIYLPRIDGVSTTAEPDEARSAPVSGRETILLVEDEEAVRDLVRGVLEGCGYSVLLAQNGEEALRLSGGHEGPIHLMVTDVVMPRMSGRELAERLASPRPTMKVLYISGYTDDAVVRHGVLSRGVAFLQKPFMPDALLRKVREMLDAATPRRTA